MKEPVIDSIAYVMEFSGELAEIALNIDPITRIIKPLTKTFRYNDSFSINE